MADVFISYSRRNSVFAHKLVEALKNQDQDVWIDLDEIPPSTEWWATIKEGIDKAHTFIPIVTPELLSSPVCTFEMDYALKNNKRIVPVMHDEVVIAQTFGNIAAIDPTSFLAEILGGQDLLEMARNNWLVIEKLNWIFIQEEDKFEDGVDTLIDAINTDLERVRLETRILARSHEWIARGQDDSVLTGNELREAKSWYRLYGEINGTDSQIAFIQASLDKEAEDKLHEELLQKRALNRARLLAASLAIFLVVAIGLSVFAFNQSDRAQTAASNLETQVIRADNNAVSATVAQGEALIQADTAVAAQETAIFEADNAATQENIALANATQANQNAATATVAQGEAEFQARTAVAAQVTSDANAGQAQTQAVVAQNNAATATVALGEANIARIEAQRNADEANAQRVALVSEQVYTNISTSLGISLALQANTIDNPPIEAQRILSSLAYTPGIQNVIEIPGEEIWSVEITPDGSHVLVSYGLGSLVMINIENNEIVREYSGHTDSIWDIEFIPSSQRFLTASWDNTIIEWDLDSSSPLRTYEAHSGTVRSITISDDGMFAASGSDDRTIVIWDLTNGTMLNRLEGHDGIVFDVDFSGDGEHLISASEDGSLIVWNLNTGNNEAQLTGHTAEILSVEYFPDSHRVVSASADQSLIIWDIQNARIVRRLVGHNNYVNNIAISWDGRRIISGGVDNTVILWDAFTGEMLHQFEDHDDVIWGLDFSSSTSIAVSSGEDGKIIIWNTEYGAIERFFVGHENDRVNEVTLIRDDSLVISASDDNSLILWDFESGDIIRQFIGHNTDVVDFAVSPDDQMIASVSCARRNDSNCEEGEIIIWDIDTGNIIRQFTGHSDWINNVDFSPVEQRIVTASLDGDTIIWDIEDGTVIYTLNSGSSWVAVFSPDGRIVYATSCLEFTFGNCSGSFVWSWDIQNATVTRTEAHRSWIWDIAVSNDGQRIVTSSADGTLRLFNRNLDTIVILEGHTRSVTSVTFMPDSNLILSGGRVGEIFLWDIETQSISRQYNVQNSPIVSLAVTSDGGSFISSSEAGDIILWRYDNLPDLIQWTFNNRHIEELDCEQRSRYDILNSDCANHVNSIAWDYYNIGEINLAIQEFEQAFALEPNNLSHLDDLGYIYYDHGDYDLALETFNRILEIDPEFAHAHFNIGRTYTAMGELELAIEAFTTAIEIEPRDYVFNWRGWRYIQLEQYDNAIEDFTQAMELAPNDPNDYLGRGNAYYFSGQYAEALLDYQRYIELSGVDADQDIIDRVTELENLLETDTQD